MGKIIIVTGLPGVGKTRVINDAVNLAKDKYEIKTFGSEMFAVAKKEGITNNRDKMRKMSYQIQKDLQIIAAKNISGYSKKSNIIIDTHSTMETPFGYFPGLPLEVLEKITPKTIVLIEADEKDIMKRRKTDNTRERDKDTIEHIMEEQQINRPFAASYCTLTGASLAIIKNRQGAAVEAAKELARLLD